MAHLIGKPANMALCCLLVVVLSVVYPVAAFQTGEQASLDTGKEAGALTSGLPETLINDSKLQVSNLRLSKQGGYSHGGAILSDSQTLVTDFCTDKDISITQSSSGFSGSGIPEFHVEIINNCDCTASNIHLYCGQFTSAEPLDPDTFKRLDDNYCLVNGGKPVPHGTLIAFTYANSFMYPLSFKGATFC